MRKSTCPHSNLLHAHVLRPPSFARFFSFLPLKHLFSFLIYCVLLLLLLLCFCRVSLWFTFVEMCIHTCNYRQTFAKCNRFPIVVGGAAAAAAVLGLYWGCCSCNARCTTHTSNKCIHLQGVPLYWPCTLKVLRTYAPAYGHSLASIDMYVCVCVLAISCKTNS